MGYSKYLLMLGAGLMQKPAIESAKNLGWHVTVVDGNPCALCAPLAHRFEPIDLKDREALAAFAQKLKAQQGLDAVFTAGTDFSASVSYIAEKCGLNANAHGFEAALNATDKSRMRALFAKNAVPSPLFAEADAARLRELEARCAEAPADSAQGVRALLGIDADFPLVVKPVDNMGARGCVTVRTFAELCAAVKDAVRYSRTGRAIIEEYMDGPEFSIDSLVYGGKIIVTGFADRHIFYPPYFIEMGHTMSSSLGKAERDRVIGVFAQGVRALGLSAGCAKGDMKLTKKGAMVGEIAARLSGGYMSGWTFPYASGVNLTEQALFIAAGLVPQLFEPQSLAKLERVAENVWYFAPEKYSAERAWISIPGEVAAVLGMEEAAKTQFVKDVLPRAAAGDAVAFPLNNVEKCGNCISCAASSEDAARAAEDAVSSIVLRLKVDNKATEDFLNSTKDFPPPAFALAAADLAELERIPQGALYDCSQPWERQLPAVLEKYLGCADWNHKTMRRALEQFAALAPKARVNAREFWRAFVRGSVQAALYMADCSAGRAE